MLCIWQIGTVRLAFYCIFMIKMIPGITVCFQIYSLLYWSGWHAVLILINQISTAQISTAQNAAITIHKKRKMFFKIMAIIVSFQGNSHCIRVAMLREWLCVTASWSMWEIVSAYKYNHCSLKHVKLVQSWLALCRDRVWLAYHRNHKV